jgi:hypothetical protein
MIGGADTQIITRELLELENRLPKLEAPIQAVDPLKLDGANDVDLITTKVNELIRVVNAITTELNKTTKLS